MMRKIDEMLMGFRNCFTRRAAFQWFVVIVIGIMVRGDHMGVTSVIRDLCLTTSYEAMVGFFRSSAWGLDKLWKKWQEIVAGSEVLYRVDGKLVMAGDGTKQAKEGRRMPGVKRLHQESEDVSKSAPYIHGHMFGAISVLVGNASKTFSVYVGMMLHDGVKEVRKWDEGKEPGSHIVEMVKMAYAAAENMGERAIVLLDRYFGTTTMLETLDGLNAKSELLSVIVKMKNNCVGYEEPSARTGKRGRPPKKGRGISLMTVFDDVKSAFVETNVEMYGKTETVRYYSSDLLWGKGLYRKLRFVFVRYGDAKSILASTDLTIDPIKVISLYSRRFTIENSFREFKHVVYGFAYRFWTKHMPRLNRWGKKTDPDPLGQIEDERGRAKIRLAVRATECYVFVCSVALGLLQMLSVMFSGTKELAVHRWQRTVTHGVWSEAAVSDYLRKNIFRILTKQAGLGICQIINSKQGTDFVNDTAA